MNIPVLFFVNLWGHLGLVRTRVKCHNVGKSQLIVWLGLDNRGRAFRVRYKDFVSVVMLQRIRLYVLSK